MSTGHAAHRGSIVLGIAAAAGIAAILGTATAHADGGITAIDPIALLDTYNTDINEAEAVLNAAGLSSPISPNTLDLSDSFEAVQQPLLSSDNSLLSDLAHLLFNGPDQQLEQISSALLADAQNAVADPLSTSAETALTSAGFQYDASLFASLLPTFIGKTIDQVFDVGGFDTATSGVVDVAGGAGTDLATGLDPTGLFAL